MDFLDSSKEPELTDLEREILAFEKRYFRKRGDKHVALSRMFNCSTIRYFQVLNHLMDTPKALIAEPSLVNRLLRQRDERRKAHPNGF